MTLTRDTIESTPPHFLFTTTEMLNRGLADAGLRPVFVGETAATRPRALLLDEVHTYGGVHGAQVALLLRRWRHALGPRAPLHIVGLSATLESPAAFLAMLTGLPDVQEISPQPERNARAGGRVRHGPARKPGVGHRAALDDDPDGLPARAAARVAPIFATEAEPAAADCSRSPTTWM